MRRTWGGLGWVAAVLLALVGCTTPETSNKPPKHPDEYNVPPSDDPRYTRPPEYAKDVLNRDVLPKQKDDAGAGGPGAPGSAGMPGGRSPSGRMGGSPY